MTLSLMLSHIKAQFSLYRVKQRDLTYFHTRSLRHLAEIHRFDRHNRRKASP